MTLTEVGGYSRQHREKPSHLTLQSIYLNSAKFSQFTQKDFCRNRRCHLSTSCVQSSSPPLPPPDPNSRAWPIIAKTERVLISGQNVFKHSGKTNQTFGLSRAIFVSILLENENFIQILDNSPVLITSGTGLEFCLSGIIIYGHGNTARGKNTQRFTAFQVLLVVNKGKIKATNFKVMMHHALSLKPNIFGFPASPQRLPKG